MREIGEMDGGRSPRPMVVALIALASAVLFVVFPFDDVGDLLRKPGAALPWGPILGYLAAMAIGGAIAGYLLAGAFGGEGPLGWLLVGFGGIVATTFGGLVGSLVGMLPDFLANGLQADGLLASGAGALILPFALTGWPALILIWATFIVATHLWARRRRTM
jgi:hypothetical protein